MFLFISANLWSQFMVELLSRGVMVVIVVSWVDAWVTVGGGAFACGVLDAGKSISSNTNCTA